MNFLDMRTVMFSHIVTDVVCALVMSLLWFQNRKRFAGTAWWLLDFMLQAAATMLIILRGSIPDWISMVLANTLVLAGALCGYLGLERFVGQRSSQVHNYMLLAAFAGVHSYFVFVQPNLSARSLNLSLGLLMLCGQCAWLMLRRVEPGMRPLTRGVGLVFTGYCIVSLIRIIAFLTGLHPDNDFFKSGAFETLVLLSYQMLLILLTYSLALMVNGRLLIDIRTQEEKFTKAFHSSPYAITITRLTDGKIFEVNDGFVNLAGYQADEVIGKTTPELHLWVQEDDRARVVNALAQQQHIHEQECQFRKKSGEIMTGLFSAEMLTINNQPCVLSSISDITARKRAAEALRETNDYLENLFNYANAPIIVWDPQFKITRFNHAFEALTGKSAQEVLGKSLEMLFPPAQINTSMNLIRKTLTGERWEVVEINIQHVDGSIRTVLWNSATLFSADGTTPIATIAQGQDVTERKRAEEALRESEVRFKTLFSILPMGVSILDQERHLIDANPALEQILALPRERLLAGNYSRRTYLRSDRTPMPMEEFPSARAFKGQTAVHNVEIGVVKEDGELIWTSVSASPFPLPGLGVAIVTVDITDRKQAEETIKNLAKFPSENPAPILRLSQDGIILYANELSHALLHQWGSVVGGPAPQAWRDLAANALANQSKTIVEIELGQQVLSFVIVPIIDEGYVNLYGEDITARKQAEQERRTLSDELIRKNKELEQLVYVTSHDLRSPLVNIQGFSKELHSAFPKIAAALQDEGVPGHVKAEVAALLEQDMPEALHYILTSATKMEALLTGLLKLSRLGRAALTITPLDMNTLIANVRDAFEFQFQETGVQIEVSELPFCHGDATQINQVFSNLVDNALKYLDPTRAPGMIKIWGYTENAQAIYCVADNGIGVAPAHQQKIFEIFHRLHPTRTTGEGLGLAIVQKILERQGGKVWVESEPGKGSKFYVSLPRGEPISTSPLLHPTLAPSPIGEGWGEVRGATPSPSGRVGEG